MCHRWLIICAILSVLTACAKPPHQELDAAEFLVARAYAYQAPTYAADEYQAAFAALEDGHRLIAARDFPASQASLAFSRQHALRAYAVTEMAKAREAAEAEARRLAEEAEARRLAAEAEARRKSEEAEARRKSEESRKTAEARIFSNYRVSSGDTLASIAALPGVYGDPLLWPLLYQGNRDQIKDPTQIHIGQTLRIPRGLMASDFEMARQRAREAGLFGLSPNPASPVQAR